jgi:hypothetical protein
MRTLKPVKVRIHGFIGAVCIEMCTRNCIMLCILNWRITNFLQCLSQCVWDEYKYNLSKIPANNKTKHMNPLGFNKNTGYGVNDPLNPNGGLLDVVNRHYNQIISSQYPSLVGHLLELLINGNICDAYNFLISIRGVGDKIACLFLRDISIIHNLNLYGDCRDLLYKPIDGVVTKVIEELVKCKCKLDYDFDINESLKMLDPKEVKCIEQLRKKAKIKNEDFKKLYPYKIFLYYYSKRCNLDQRWVEMGMWFFRSKVMNYYKKKLCDYTIESACEDLIRRLRKAIKNTNIKYIGNDQFEIIDANGNKIVVDEDKLIKLLLSGEIEIYDELLDIIFF